MMKASLIKRFKGFKELDAYCRSTSKVFYSEVIGKTWVGLKRYKTIGERPYALNFRFPTIMPDGRINVQQREVAFRTKPELLRFTAFLDELRKAKAEEPSDGCKTNPE